MGGEALLPWCLELVYKVDASVCVAAHAVIIRGPVVCAWLSDVTNHWIWLCFVFMCFSMVPKIVFGLFIIFVISLLMLPGISWIQRILHIGDSSAMYRLFYPFCQPLISLCARIHKNNWQTSKLIKWQSPYLATKDIRKRRNAGTALQGQKGF